MSASFFFRYWISFCYNPSTISDRSVESPERFSLHMILFLGLVHFEVPTPMTNGEPCGTSCASPELVGVAHRSDLDLIFDKWSARRSATCPLKTLRMYGFMGCIPQGQALKFKSSVDEWEDPMTLLV
jgi:hypothetical protein